MMVRIRRYMADKDQGFTLIELLVVIIIIGILAAIAIPVFLNQRKKAVDASLKSDLHNAAAIVEAWAVDKPGAPLAPGLWEYASAPGKTGGVLDGLKVSPGNAIWLVSSASPATVGGWCLYAANPNASKATNAPWMAWRSLRGGLDPILSTIGSSDCA